MDLRIQVEATLSHLFDRRIRLEWDSGNLKAFASVGLTGTSYRLDRDECHGIKELFVLLTHLYNNEHPYLIIDEPELNLHPQFQAFFMQEVRRVAGTPAAGSNKKIVFLITHSPFILDFRTVEDVKSVISFSGNHTPPRQLFDLPEDSSARLAMLVPRLNVHHKQLFFADNPIFVEGIFDAQILGAMQESRGVSIAGAGSCIIDAGGCEEVNRYYELCLLLGKQAHFVYDLDSLFGGNLRACVKSDNEVSSFLASAGVGSDFARYCGEIDRALTGAIDRLLEQPDGGVADSLVTFLLKLGARSGWDGKTFKKAWVAVLTTLSRFRDALLPVLGEIQVADIEGRIAKIGDVLRAKRIHILMGGTLERYLPSFVGNSYDVQDAEKRAAVEAEMMQLSVARADTWLQERYGALFSIVALLPSKLSVDVDALLRDYLSKFIHDIQSALVTHPAWGKEELIPHLENIQMSACKVFRILSVSREEMRKFQVTIEVAPLLSPDTRTVHISHATNVGVGDFVIHGK